MDSRRMSSGQSSKAEEKADDDALHTPSTESNLNDSPDLEKGDGQQHEKGQQQQPSSKPEDTAEDPFLVKFEENDPENPKNWSANYKACLTLLLGMLAFAGSFGSSVISPAQPEIAKEFGISEEVTVLTVSLYVLGFAFGPSLWAPISEVYGRKVSILPAVFILGLFSIGSAASKSAASLLITRFFGGVFGSAPISNVSGALGDLYEPKARGVAVTFYAVAVVGGPTIAPVVGSALTVTLGWRWTEWIEAILVFFIWAIALFALPEVFPLVILKRKAKRLRKETGDDRYWHPHEKEKIDPHNIFQKHLSRPIRMLCTEPMVTCIAIYASFVYGLVYLTLELFPIVYREERHWGTVVSTLPFLGLFIGKEKKKKKRETSQEASRPTAAILFACAT